MREHINRPLTQRSYRCDDCMWRSVTAVNAFPSRLGRALEAAALAVFALASFLLVARIGLAPRDPSQGVGVVFAPWTGADAAFVRAVEAGGRFVRFGGLPFIVVVTPEAADYADRVRAAGALFIVDPLILAACLPSSSGAQASQ
jgi:hypothetical protein